METEKIAVDRPTYDRIELLSLAWEVSPGETVRRLLDRFQQQGPGQEQEQPSAPAPAAPPLGTVPVHAVYAATRTSGFYDPLTENLTIPAGMPGAGHYKTPSGAAAAVLQALKPTVKPNRNGWGFWVVDETGELLQSIRR
ncbi:hypothetical protein [Streptomyces sp. NPDC001594]|uniref:hypothetical protein n=1 Tax=Streptomyces sp. NPDC001594 TaxID=3364590 RepID=UPI0036C7B281